LAKILIIDDDINIINVVCLKLHKDGHDVLTATDGKTGLEKIIEFNPDLIILDVIMPEINGYEILIRIKSDPELVKIPVIILTTRWQLEDKVKGLDQGADDYLSKPFELRELSARVDALLRIKELQNRLVKSERLAAVGKLALSIKSEIDEPLASIILKTRTLLKKDISSEFLKRMNLILESSERIRTILKKLEVLDDTPVKDYLKGVKMIDLS